MMKNSKRVMAVFLVCVMVLGANVIGVCAKEQTYDSGWIKSPGANSTVVTKQCWNSKGSLNYGTLFVSATTSKIYADFRPNCKCKFTIYAGVNQQSGSYVSKTHGPTITEYGISYTPGAKTGYGRVKLSYTPE